MKKTIFFLMLMFPFAAFAQDSDTDSDEPFVKRTTTEAGIMLSTSGDLTSTSLNVMQYWGFGKKNRKFKVGLGGRLNSYFGNDNLEYITASGKLTGEIANIDTLKLSGTQANALNLFLALRYDITERWGVEVNIDLAGFSFGGEKDGDLKFNEGMDSATKGTPTPGNLLLIGDNDKGNVNSEFLITYRYKSNWRFKAGAMFQFLEYSIDPVYKYTNSKGTVLQTERYRSKNITYGIGVNYIF